MAISSFDASRAWPSHILASDRLLEPIGADLLLEEMTHRQGGAVVVALVGIDAQPNVVAQCLADSRQPIGVRLGVGADLDLDAHHALVEVRPRGVEDLLGTHPQPGRVRAVGRGRLAGAAEQLVQRQAGRLALEVPQGHVDRRVRLLYQAAPADRLQAPVHLRRQPFVVQGVLADDQRGQVVLGDRQQCPATALQGVGEAKSAQTRVRVDVDEQDDDVVEPARGGLGRRGARPGQRDVQKLIINSDDPHGLSFLSLDSRVHFPEGVQVGGGIGGERQ